MLHCFVIHLPDNFDFESAITRRAPVVSVLTLISFFLVSCSTQPTLSERAIDQFKIVKIVYVEPSYDVNVYTTDHFTGLIEHVYFKTGDSEDTLKTLTSSELQVLHTLDFKVSIRLLVEQVIAQTPWLAHRKIETVPSPLSDDDEWKMTRSTHADAVIFLTPYIGFPSNGSHFITSVIVDIFVNSPERGTYFFEGAGFGRNYELRRPNENPKGPPKSPWAIPETERFTIWFSHNANQLKSDFESTLPITKNGLFQYLKGDRQKSASPGTAEGRTDLESKKPQGQTEPTLISLNTGSAPLPK